MRRKSDRTKEKEKLSPEKKPEKATRRSRRHSSRWRKRSSSTSEHESATEENETALKSHGDTEEEPKSRGCKEEVDPVNTDAKEKDVGDETAKFPTSRRSSKKMTTDEMGGSKSQDTALGDDDWKEDKSFWESEEGKTEISEPRHKEKDGKSSVWQVKSSNDGGSNGGGEIKKIKLCIVRPSETLEPSPRRRKRLSRTMTSHKDKSDTQECEEADDDRGEDDKKVLESSDGKENFKKSSDETTGNKSLHDERKVSPQEHTEQSDVSEERSQQGRNSAQERGQASLQNQDQTEVTEQTVDQESTGDKQNVQDSDVKEDALVQVVQDSDVKEDTLVQVVQDSDVKEDTIVQVVQDSDAKEDALVQESSDTRGDVSPETSGEHHMVQKPCDRTEQSDILVEDRSDGQPQLDEHVLEKKEVEVKDSCEVKDVHHVTPEEQPVVAEENIELYKAAKAKSQEELQNVEDSSEERMKDNDATVQTSKADNEEDKNTACAEADQNTTYSTIERAETSTEELKEGSSSEEGPKSKDSSEGRPEESQEVAEEVDSVERLVAHISSERTKGEKALDEGQIQDSSEENSASHEVSKSDVSMNDEVKDRTKDSSRDRSNKRTTIKRVFLEERSYSRDSSEERPRVEVKKRRQSRESNSSRSFSASPGKQIHRRGDRESTRSRIQDGEHSDKHSKKRDNNRNNSSDRQGSRRSHRRSRSPQHRREKISLRRSFSKQSNSHGREKDDVKESVKKIEASTDESHLHIKEDKENVRKTSEQTGTSQESSQSVTRRRRWGAGRTSRAGKKPVLSISTDSLKNLIPGAKPVPVSEVQLSQEEEEEERRERESEECEIDESDTREKSRNKEKDGDNQETLDRRPLAPMSVSEPHKISVAVTDDHTGKVVTRKISIVSDDARTLQNSPSPPRHKASNVLFISNLVRPFTVNQLKELLARTGTIVEGGFWIDKIKSKCYVQYETETEARETRHALHGVRWPVSNPKQLCVDFGKKEDMDLAQALTEEDQVPRKTEPLKVERTVEGWVAEQVREKERERELRERERERERERTRMKERPHHVIPAIEPLERNRNMKMSASVREWDLGKIGQLSPPEKEPKHEEKNKERERRVRREKAHHSRSPSPHDVPVRKQKKKEEDAPAKLLDDLFRKTKCTPCIYWLPLTAEQIVVKEEMRRRHMAEHERRMAEMRKAERERERVRAQQRQQRRTGERDKRRRRTASGSPKK